MNKLRCSLFFFFILVTAQNLVAQVNPIKEFSQDPIKFLDDIKTMFEATNMEKKEIHKFMEQFTLAWNSAKCNDRLKKSIESACNVMVKKKLRILPEYKSYLSSVMNCINSNQSEDNFLTWQECINKILNGKLIRSYSDYLEMSAELFATNSFYNSSVIRYSTNNNNYTFEYDSVPKVIFPSLNLRIANNQNDTSIVYATKGVYYPSKGIFIGNGGKINWTKAGAVDNTIWAELKNYQIILKNSGFIADSVTFYNKNYFQKPLKGRLTVKIISENESGS